MPSSTSPARSAATSSVALVLTALVAAACGSAPPPVEPTGPISRYHGRVVAARGPTMAVNGGTCTVEVQEADGVVLNCRIRIRCNGDLVYGLSGAGYNNCRREGERLVFAHDHNGTRGDGDPRMFFDLLAGRIVISDDDPDVEVLVDLVAEPSGFGGAAPEGGPVPDPPGSEGRDDPGGEPEDGETPAPDGDGVAEPADDEPDVALSDP